MDREHGANPVDMDIVRQLGFALLKIITASAT